jgi:hypothetical protein
VRWRSVMARGNEDKLGTGLRRVAAVEGNIIVNRPPREQIAGLAFQAQHCSLVLDRPDAAGHEFYPCKITNLSDGGFCAECSAASKVPHPFTCGAQMTLHDSDGKRVRVEVRWVSNGRVGLRRLTAKPW